MSNELPPEDNINPIFDHAGGDFMKNFALLIPYHAFFKEPAKQKTTRRRLFTCLIMGHRWEPPGFSYVGPPIPRRCKRCDKLKWFKRIRSYKCVDKLMRPLCFIGLHRWKATFGFTSYCYGSNCSSEAIKREQNYSCARCKKHKSVSI